jgi:hypothetical protein
MFVVYHLSRVQSAAAAQTVPTGNPAMDGG